MNDQATTLENEISARQLQGIKEREKENAANIAPKFVMPRQIPVEKLGMDAVEKALMKLDYHEIKRKPRVFQFGFKIRVLCGMVEDD